MFRFDEMKTQPDTTKLETQPDALSTGTVRCQFETMFSINGHDWSADVTVSGASSRDEQQAMNQILTALKRPDQSERVRELEAEVERLRVQMDYWEFRHVSEQDQPADERRLVCSICGQEPDSSQPPKMHGDVFWCINCNAWLSAHVKPDQPADEWRMLEVGEIIQDGDEVYDGSRNEWVNVCESVGQPAPSPDYTPHRKFRRRVTKPETKPDEWRPWRIDEVPVGLALRTKCSGKIQVLITGIYPCENQVVVCGGNRYNPIRLFELFTQLDGTPCGARKET